MKDQTQYWIKMTFFVLIAVSTACTESDKFQPEKIQTIYPLNSVTDPTISGEVVFTKVDAFSTKVVIKLIGTGRDSIHPAHLHANSASEGGEVVFSFNPVQGTTGSSESTITKLNDGTPISYEDLIAFDGYVNIHQSASMMSTLIAQGNIGSNVSQKGSNASPSD